MQGGLHNREKAREAYRAQAQQLEEARQRTLRDMEEVFSEDKAVAARRPKVVRRGSENTNGTSSNGGGAVTGRGAKTRRQSAVLFKSSARADAPPPSSLDADSVLSSETEITPLGGVTAGGAKEGESRDGMSVPDPSPSSTSLPPKYQKLLDIGLSREQVRNRLNCASDIFLLF